MRGDGKNIKKKRFTLKWRCQTCLVFFHDFLKKAGELPKEAG
jgi:hypothetical protein